MGYQQELKFKELLKAYPQFKKIGTFRKQRWEQKGQGRTPKNKDFELAWIPDNDECREIAKVKGVYILVKDSFDFYVGHAGEYNAETSGWDQRHRRYKGGLGQLKDDTNSKIAEHAAYEPFTVFYFPNPTTNINGRELYIGEAIETDCIVSFQPILNTRNY